MKQQNRKRQPVGDVAPAGSARPLVWIVLGLIAVTAIVYARVWRYDFVNFDDDDYVYANPIVSAGITPHGLQWALTTQLQSNWHPVTWFSHMLDVQIFGLNAGAHHVTNVLLHILNSLLLFWLLRRMTADPGRSAFVAAIFSVHPLHVESVAWISERKDVLSTLFALLTICAYIGYVRTPTVRRYGLVVLFFALGLMTKPMLVTLPFVLLLLDFWPLRRFNLREKIPLFALTLASSVVTLVVQQRGRSTTAIEVLPIAARVQHSLVSYAEYLGKVFWPSHLAAFYPYSPESSGLWILALLLLLGVSVFALKVARQLPFIPVGWFWFLGTLVPVIGLVQVGSQSMADRYMYLPLIGILFMLAWGIPQRFLAYFAGVAIVLCTIVSWFQVQYWENGFTLWNHALEVTSNNYMAELGVADKLGESGKHEEAIGHLREAVRINPGYTHAHYNLGYELVQLGNWDEAGAHFSDAIRLDPTYASAHNNLGNILMAKGKITEAAAEYVEALRISPDYVDARTNLALLFVKQGRLDDAKRELAEVLKTDPANANAQRILRDLASGQTRQ